MTKQKTWWLSGAALVTVAAAVGITLWADAGGSSAAVDSVSLRPRACLVTRTADPLNAALITATWSALQRAARADRVIAQRIPVPSAATTVALPYLNGAVSQHCRTVFAVGAPLGPALDSVARGQGQTRFVLVGAQSPDSDVVSVTGLTGARLGSEITSLLPPD